MANFVGPDEVRIEDLKRQVCDWIRRMITRRGWTQADAAFYLRTDKGNLSRVLRYKVEGISLDRLFRYLALMEPNFRISLTDYE